MTLDTRLLEILVCPIDKGPLDHLPAENLLYNRRLQRAYDIVEGIPVMLVDASRLVDDAEHQRIIALVDGADSN
jgi:uncharacterized protein YbaR (Trm112 family)